MRSRLAGWLGVAVVALAGGGCGDDEPATTTAQQETTTAAEATSEDSAPDPKPGPETPSPPSDKPTGPVENAASDPRLTAAERAAMRTVREFVAALNAGDGERACELLVPGALHELKLPRERGGCASSLAASIGYRDARGLPVWQRAEVTQVRVAEVDADSAKVIATTATTFADRDEISIEDDVIYLTAAGDGWRIAKPSSTLYRAVGIADVPPSVLSPP